MEQVDGQKSLDDILKIPTPCQLDEWKLYLNLESLMIKKYHEGVKSSTELALVGGSVVEREQDTKPPARSRVAMVKKVTDKSTPGRLQRASLKLKLPLQIQGKALSKK
jgi:hypothetical protein